MSPLTAAVAVGSGVLIGISLGALGGGGSILAVPVLAGLLGQPASQAATGSLVVVGCTSLVAAVGAWRTGTVRLVSGLTFGLLAVAGAVAGALLSARVPERWLLGGFAGLLAVVAVLMWRRARPLAAADPSPSSPARPGRWATARLVAVATLVGLLTGFFGVGGGFLVMPALVLVLAVPVRAAVGTSLVVIAMVSALALAVRLRTGTEPAWGPVLTMTAAATAATFLGRRVGRRLPVRTLQSAFSGLLVAVTALLLWQVVTVSG